MFLADNSNYKKILEKYILLNERLLIMLDGDPIVLQDLTDYKEDIFQINRETEKLLVKKGNSSRISFGKLSKISRSKVSKESKEIEVIPEKGEEKEEKDQKSENKEEEKEEEEKEKEEKEKEEQKSENKVMIELPMKSEYIVIKEREFSVPLLEKYHKAKEEIDYFYSENVNVLNIDCIKDFMISFSSYTKILEKEAIELSEKKYRNVNNLSVTISNYDDLMSLMLSDKKKVSISLRDRDFSKYTKPQLLEILKFLEIIISDTRYDELRYEITKRLSFM